jgi:predicted enzyme related to lactoylglutathione lyase
MIEFLGLRTLIYKVADLEAAKKWYTEALGFGPYFDTPFYVGFEVGGYELGIYPSDKEFVKGSNIECYLGVNDVAASHARLISLGATENSPIQDVGDGIIVATVLDPFGNVLGLIYNPHFKAQQ